MSGCDLLAIGAHPDDADLGVGGILLRAAKKGYRTAILDLTHGEMGTRGTPEMREQEAHKAGELLGLSARRNAGLPDGQLADLREQRLMVAAQIRALRPRVILAPMTPDRHPDHDAAHALARSANFLAGLSKLALEGEPHRTETMYFYYAYSSGATPPSMVIDVSDEFPAKLEALRAHASQFHQPGSTAPETYVSSEGFWQQITVRASYWGGQIGAKYGEPLFAAGPLALDLPPGLERVAG